MTNDVSRLALLFPGQGSQEKSMGRDLAEASKEAMDLWKKAEKISQAPLRDIYWDSDDAAAQAETRYLQPALTVVNVSVWMRLADRLRQGGRALTLAGHSLGEYSALAAAQVLSLDAILELTVLRGRLMAEADPNGVGKMAAAVKLSLVQAEEVVAEVRKKEVGEILIANYNSPAQFVLSGAAPAIEAAGPLVSERKGRLIPLAVSGAFHSPLMREAAAELGAYMAKLDWNAPKLPIHFNRTAALESDPERIRLIMTEQMTSSVRWIEIITAQWERGTRAWLELGPKTVLAKLLKANLADKTEPWEATSIGSLAEAEAY